MPYQVLDELPDDELAGAWADFVRYAEAREAALRERMSEHGR